MSLIQIAQPNASSKLGIWEFNEEAEDLLELMRKNDLQRLLSNDQLAVKSDRRKKELFAIRLLLNEMIKDPKQLISYDAFGKPYLEGREQKISISHCRTHCAILLHDKSDCGIDIECIDERIYSIARRFMSDYEKSYVNDDELRMLHIIWAAKEVVYKINGRHGVIFKDDIEVRSFKATSNGTLRASLRKKRLICEYHLQYEIDEGTVLVYGWED